MGLVWRRRVRLDDETDANLSKSGASLSPDRASATAEQPRGGAGRSGSCAACPGGSGGAAE